MKKIRGGKMVDVLLVYKGNIMKDGEIVDDVVLKREIVSVDKLTKKEIEKHIELGSADFVVVYYFNDEVKDWVHCGTYTRYGWFWDTIP